MKRIEFVQPNARVDDWRVKVDGRTIGSIWRAGNDYLTSVRTICRSTTLDAAFKAARKQARGLLAV